MLRAASVLLPALLALETDASAESLPRSFRGDHAVHARLLLTGGIAAGGSTVVTIELTPAIGWHIYGPEHGDAGAPPEVHWTLPAGLHAGAVGFPPSQRVRAHGLTTFEYHGPTALSVPLVADTGFTRRVRLPIRAVVRWLACSNVCVPGQATVRAMLDVVSARRGIRRVRSLHHGKFLRRLDANAFDRGYTLARAQWASRTRAHTRQRR